MVDIEYALSALTLLTHIGIVLLVIYLLVRNRIRSSFADKLLTLLTKNAVLLSLFLSLAAVFGSLFFSEIAGYPPCNLCWYQRIFIYPQAVLFIIALVRKTKGVFTYSLPLSIIGGIIGLYHNILVYTSTGLCTEGGSCITDYFTSFGYVNIPMMSLTAFAVLILLAILGRSSAKARGS